jgi:hypothetical protein
LDECVASLVAQSYGRWECIIVDDGSSDQTPEVSARLNRADSRIRSSRQENRGLSAARNAGIRRARGEFVQLLDADDLLEPDKLRLQVHVLEASPDIDVVVGGAAFFGGAKSTKLRRWPRKIGISTRRDNQHNPVLAEFVAENIFPVHAALSRRTLFDSVGFFDESLRAHEDWDFWLRSAVRGHQFSFVCAGNDRALVRRHDTNMSRSSELMSRTTISVRERIQSVLPAQLALENSLRLSEAKWKLGLDLVRGGRLRDGWNLYREGFQSSPQKWMAALGVLLLVPGVPTAVRVKRRIVRHYTSFPA